MHVVGRTMFDTFLAFLSYVHVCSAIVGGQPEPSTELVIRIYNNQKRAPMCYGALISPRHVITATACSKVKPFSTTVALGNDVSMHVINTRNLGNGLMALELVSDVNLTAPGITSLALADTDFESSAIRQRNCKFYSYGPTSRRGESTDPVANSITATVKKEEICWLRDSYAVSYSHFDACIQLPKNGGMCRRYEIGAPLICETDLEDRTLYGRYVLYGVFDGRAKFRGQHDCKARYVTARLVSPVQFHSFSLIGRQVGQTCAVTSQCIGTYSLCVRDYVNNMKHCTCMCPGEGQAKSCTTKCLIDFNKLRSKVPLTDGRIFNIWNITAGGSYLQIAKGKSPSRGTLEEGSPDASRYIYFESSDSNNNGFSVIETTLLVDSDMCLSFEYSSFSRYPQYQGNFSLIISAPDGSLVTQDLNTTMYKSQWQSYDSSVPHEFILKETTFMFKMYDGDSYRSDHGLDNIFLRYSQPNASCVFNL